MPAVCLLKKRSEDTQTLRAGCSKAEPKKISPPPAADPLPGGAERPKFNQLEMVATFIYKPSLARIDARNFELSWYQTHPQTPPARCKQTGPITIHCVAKLSAQCNKRTE